MTLREGDTFAGYTVVRPIGAGGMGEVYLADHPRLPKRVALKLLGGAISTDAAFRERFLREADLAARLWHPHIVSVQDRGEDDGRLWIAMDYVDGCDAAQLLKNKYTAGMPQELVIPIVRAVASALDHAHGHGLLHRDVKPANIMISHLDDPEQRRILLTDFGIARESDDVSGLTQTNMTLGTVAYAAPEQLIGGDIDSRADQYALAATAYHLLTGLPVFPNTNPAAIIGQHLNSVPPRFADTRPELARLDPAFAVALAKNPADRFSRCSDFAQALGELSAGKGTAPAAFALTAEAPVAPRPDAVVDEMTPLSAPDAQTRRTSATTILGLALLVALLIVAGLLFIRSRNPGQLSSPTTTFAAPSSASISPSTVTVSVSPPPTITRTVTPTAAVTPSYNEPTRPTTTGWPVMIVGTCDEGGSCGVQQRAQPNNSAPRLYPDVLKDGAQVVIVCGTIGDQRESQGHGSSVVWYMLDNGAYINSVFTTPPSGQVPLC